MMKKEEVIITNSFEETQRLGEEFARSHLVSLQGETFSGALIVALYGDLGSGKTTFVQGLAKGLGIERRIISPTFIIIRSYKLGSQKSKVPPEARLATGGKSQKYNSKFKSFGQKTFFHTDLYRIKSERDTLALGLEEILNDPENIVAIEWAEKIRNLLPRKRWDMRFEYLGRDKRRIVFCHPEFISGSRLIGDAEPSSA